MVRIFPLKGQIKQHFKDFFNLLINFIISFYEQKQKSTLGSSNPLMVQIITSDFSTFTPFCRDPFYCSPPNFLYYLLWHQRKLSDKVRILSVIFRQYFSLNKLSTGNEYCQGMSGRIRQLSEFRCLRKSQGPFCLKASHSGNLPPLPSNLHINSSE